MPTLAVRTLSRWLPVLRDGTALPYCVYASAGSPVATALTFAGQITPMILFRPIDKALANLVSLAASP
jgi:hypothetical protein